MQSTALRNSKASAAGAGSSTPAPALFNRDASRDLEQIEEAIGNLREAWRVLTPIGHRHVFACGLILEIAAMLGDLASERRRIEEQAGV